MKWCCLCGERILPGDYLVTVTQHRLIQGPNEEEVLVRVPMEDESFRKYAHSLCPAIFGAPLALVGADGTRTDV